MSQYLWEYQGIINTKMADEVVRIIELNNFLRILCQFT